MAPRREENSNRTALQPPAAGALVKASYGSVEHQHQQKNGEEEEKEPDDALLLRPPDKNAGFTDDTDFTARRSSSSRSSLNRGSGAATSATAPSHRQRSENGPRRVLIKTQSGFWEDASSLAAGSIPHSAVVAVTVGTVCGAAAWIYYGILERALDLLWRELPEKFVGGSGGAWWPDSFHFLWIPLTGFVMATCVGLTVKYVGEPGDLPYTIKCVHDTACVAMSHVPPMVAASQFSILGGGSLGPEAPLVAVCAALAGFISRAVFGTSSRNLLRKHTLMGMAGALAAFFGCPLGGSLFALEVNSRFGIEYFEHTIEAVFCGEVCLVVFRALAGLPVAPIWQLADSPLRHVDPVHILSGAVLGLVGALAAFCFATFHWKVMDVFRRRNLLDNRNAVYRAWIGATVVVGLGLLVPHTLFWGEYEFQTIATLSPSSELPHVWPGGGAFGFEMNSAWTALAVGVCKLVAISFTVAGGYRGGYIFPFFASGAALGRAIFFLCPFLPVQLCVLCMAAAINVAITRTAIATTLILSYLAGEQNCISGILAASLVSLFATGYMPFIPTQMSRNDLEESLWNEDFGDDDGRARSETCETAALTPLTTEDHKVPSVGNDDAIELNV